MSIPTREECRRDAATPDEPELKCSVVACREVDIEPCESCRKPTCAGHGKAYKTFRLCGGCATKETSAKLAFRFAAANLIGHADIMCAGDLAQGFLDISHELSNWDVAEEKTMPRYCVTVMQPKAFYVDADSLAEAVEVGIEHERIGARPAYVLNAEASAEAVAEAANA